MAFAVVLVHSEQRDRCQRKLWSLAFERARTTDAQRLTFRIRLLRGIRGQVLVLLTLGHCCALTIRVCRGSDRFVFCELAAGKRLADSVTVGYAGAVVRVFRAFGLVRATSV